MKRWFLLCLAIMACLSARSGGTGSLQELFFNAGTDAGIRKFYQAAQGAGDSQALTRAYKGAATAMYAGVASSVADKLSYFRAGRKLLESAVQQDPDHAEIRFLRLAVQVKAPGILGYSGDIRTDADFIIRALEQGRVSSGTAFWKQAVSFMLGSGGLTAAEKQRLQKMQ